MFSRRQARLASFYEGLAVLLDAGIPLGPALAHGEGQHTLLREPTLLAEISLRVDRGEALARILDDHPRVFPAFHRELIRAGEASGELPKTLRHLCQIIEERIQAQRELTSRLIYPVVLLHAAIFLPGLHLCVSKGPDAYLASTLPILFGLWFTVLAAWGIWRLLHRAPAVKAVLDAVILQLPVVGPIHRRSVMIDVMLALDSLYRAAVPIEVCFRQGADLARNAVLSRQVAMAGERVRQGASLEEVVGALPGLPPGGREMLSTGAIAGRLDEALERVRKLMQERNRRAITTVTKLLPVAVYLLIVLYVGYVIISFWSSLYGQLPG